MATTAAAAVSNLSLLLPSTLPRTFSLPTRILRTARAPPRRLRTAASRTLAPPATSETPEAEELRQEAESALEWGGVCARLADFASTAAGRSACGEGRVPVGRSREESERLLEQTSAASLLSAPLDFGGVGDVSAVVDAAARGRLLAVREICGVGRSLRAARGVLDQVKSLAEETPDGRYSPLLDILQGCDFLTELVKMIEFCLDANLSMVLDRASERLGTIRKERKMNAEMLESLLRDVSVKIFQAGGVDNPVVTKRRSRMCVGVKASHKHLVPGGIVLSSSGSGATYFMEPRDAVKLNNTEVKLSGDERAEELAVLGLLTSRIAESRTKIRHLMGKILELDLACARGSYALWINGVRPAFSDRDSSGESDPSSTYSVFIEGIRHPLLLEQSLGIVEESTAEATKVGKEQLTEDHPVSSMPVPLDMHVKNDTRIIVISGPNTGGKTATMKTLGLASLMSKAGMFFPAKGRPRLPWFDQVLADIGDHQSLENSLSTFSGNISRLRKIAQVVSTDSLVLIDEIGSGTDPSEGVSLSTSILKYLASRLNLAVVTTHYADLSRLKAVDDRFENAAMEFCLETLKPTYRVLWGSTGNSNALSIAKSIGFDQKVLDRAQEWVEKLLPDKQKERQGLLYGSLLDERNLLESQANEVASVLSEVEELYNEIRLEADDLDSRVAALKARESQKVQQELKTLKSKMDLIIKNFEIQLKNSKLKQYNAVMRKAEAATASLAAAHQPTEFSVSDDENKSSYVPQIGDKVYVEGLGGGTMATVVEILSEDGSCMVQYGKIKVRAKNNKMKLAQRDTKETSTSSSVQGKWLKKTHRNPLYKAMEKMKEEMMLLGFISLLLAATSRIISGICIDSKYYDSKFSPCTKEEVEESLSAEHALTRKRNHIIDAILHHSLRRNLKAQYHHVQTCPEGYESFVSHEGLEQLHRFIFVMAVTHVTYSCLTMLLAILKVHTWRKWEDEAFRDNHESFSQIAYVSATRRQPPALTKSSSFRFWSQNNAVMWVFCFLAQFGQSVVRADYLILRKGFIMNHNLAPMYDFHTYMIRSMEEEFEKIVGVSGVLWGFVVAFMLFNINGSNLYFWIAILPVALVLLVGAKLQHVIAILTSEGAKLTAFGPRIKPRDDLFWFKKPKFLLWLIHFVLFQNAFELASFFWFWWQFGYDSCFIKNHLLVYCRLILGFAGQFLCSYSTLPVYALVTQMGSKYKAALIPNRIRETMHGWGKDARKKRRKKRRGDDSTIRTETSTVCSLDYEDEDDDGHGHSDDATPPRLPPYLKIELRPMRGGGGIPRTGTPSHHLPAGGNNWTPRGSSQHALLQQQGSASASAPSSPPPSSHGRGVIRSASMPGITSVATIGSTIGISTPPTQLSDAHA